MTEEVVEQITIDPPTTKNKKSVKEKDPKKVAAGKAMAEKNRLAREALAREMKREKEQAEIKQEENSNQESEPKAWLPELSFTTVLSIFGIGFTAFDMFMRYYKNRIPDLSQVPTKVPPSNIPVPQPPPTQIPKIGML